MKNLDDKTFTGRIAILSGGLGDIGRQIATALAAKGADVALGDRLPAADATAFLQTLEALGVRAHYTQVDVSQAEPVRRWVEECEQTLGLPDVIIANAATVTLANFAEVTPKQWDDELQINLSGPFYLTKFVTDKLVAAKTPGHIVLIGSWAAHVVHAHIPAYSVSKAGLRMLGKCLALELAPHDILVNEIAPGYVDAGLTAQIWKTNPALKSLSEGKVPVKRLIGADEVAAQVIHLCDRSNRHMTGSTLLMDGGLSMLSV
jgi:glucose 1-dehydrogenase